jgi:ubiquinone/menaquinone biosynthesis C-methylase UbiE
VLDLGSGGGIDVFLAARQVGQHGRSIGLDMTDEMLERAEANRRKLGFSNAFFLKGEIENIPLPAESVDWILSNCVINLVPDKKNAFREMYRVLSPGGSFVISDIVTDGSVPELYRKDADLWAGCVSGAIDRGEYLGVIRDAGFEAVEILSERSAAETGNLPFSVRSITVKATKQGTI